VGDLETEDFRQLLRELRDRKLGQQILAHVRTFSRAICTMAYAEGYLDRDLTRSLDPVKSTEARKPRLTITVGQYSDVWSLLAERERLAFDLVLFCGLRESETYALQVGDLMPQQNGIEVQRSWHQGSINPTKTGSPRKIGVPGPLMERLRGWTADLPDTSCGGWLFPSSRVTTPVWPGNVLGKIKTKLKPAGFGWVNFAVLRRSHSTLQEQLKTDPRLVSAQQGRPLP
jgi:integrase